MNDDSPGRNDAILKLGRDKVLAHRVLFGHRHGNLTPPYHDEHIDLWHSSMDRFIEIVFRGGAKSTRAEEAIVLEACLQMFRNCVILGESETRAAERLRAIKHELNTNPYVEEMFGPLGEGTATTWGDTRIVLNNGVCIQAYGRGQSLRGVKHLDQRPDLLFVDDLEDEEAVATPLAQEKWKAWFMSVVMPALDVTYRARIAGTPLDPKALLEVLAKDQAWQSRRVPIKFKDPETGEWVATWPDRFPLEWIDAKEGEYARLGLQTRFAQEYMCQAEDVSQKPFTADLFRVEPQVRTWHPVWAMVDPARTVTNRSATTGICIWSWVNNRLIVWDAYGKRWKPDEIIADMFRIADTYQPVAIGVEEDGLNEFILQPVRQEQIRRGYAIPLLALKAPKGKIDFIKGLQPFFKAREVIFSTQVPDLASQLLSFPTGEIDVPNALAYALKMRPGVPVYDTFGSQHIHEGEMALVGNALEAPAWLAVNASQAHTTAVLLQYHDRVLRIVADWVKEGDPGASLSAIIGEAGLEGGRAPRVIAGLSHFGFFDTIGMRAAAKKVPVELRRGGDPALGRQEIRAALTRMQRGSPCVLISTRARWTLNGFTSGYARMVGKGGVLNEEATENVYRTLIEGVEAFASLIRAGVAADGSDSERHYATTAGGQKYLSSMVKGGRA